MVIVGSWCIIEERGDTTRRESIDEPNIPGYRYRERDKKLSMWRLMAAAIAASGMVTASATSGNVLLLRFEVLEVCQYRGSMSCIT